VAADDAGGAGGLREVEDDFGGLHGRLRGEAEGEGLEGVAGEERGGVVEGDVAGGAAAAQDVVVHAGEVVVDEGVGVEALDGGGRAACDIVVGAAGFGGRGAEDGAQAFAAGEQRVAHGGVEPRRTDIGGGDEGLQGGFGPGTAVGEIGDEVEWAGRGHEGSGKWRSG